ncbi:MAG: helix-turn-helix domain-containing protein [Phormidesmis sp.]
MTLSLSVPEFLSQHPDVAVRTEAMRSPWEIPLQDPSGRSHGYRQEVNLRPGLSLLIDDYTLAEDLVVDIGPDEACEPCLDLELSFMLSGNNRLEGVRSRHNFLMASWEDTSGGQFHWRGGERVLKFDIHIEPELFESLLGEQFASLPGNFSQIARSDRPTSQGFWQVTSTTGAMRSAIQQLLNCPYEGPTRWLYYEGKVLELIALRLAQSSEYTPKKQLTLQPDDVERIYYACDILRQRLANPPSLIELARLVGLNDCKLKKGFRQIFGTTVFGCLSQQRMQKACELLEQQQSVSAVAIAVGYASPTTFSGAFKKEIGVSPKRYQLGKYSR